MSTVNKRVKQVKPLNEPSVELYELAQTVPAEEFETRRQVREFIWRIVLLDRMNRPIQETRARGSRKQTSVYRRH